MKKSIIVATFLFITLCGHTQNFDWAKRFGGTDYNMGMSIAVDAVGNVHTTGTFGWTADFDPGPGVFNLSASPGYSDVFISKLGANGNFLWAKRIGGQYEDRAYSITVDGTGNVYVTGYFEGTVDFDPGPGVYNLTSMGWYAVDLFILKLDASGNFVWAKRMGDGDNVFGFSIAVDAFQNVYTTGYFMGTADFDPGPGVSYLADSNYVGNAFVSKLDINGNFIWAKQITGYSWGNSVALDASGNVYVTGFFGGLADFDPGPGTFYVSSTAGSYDYDMYVLKLNASGSFVWAKIMQGNGSVHGNSITVNSGFVYVTGEFRNTIDFDPGPGTFLLTSLNWTNPFIVKLDVSGNLVWARQIAASYYALGLSIDVDASGNVFTAGSFWDIADFDPGPGVYNLTPVAYQDVYILKLDNSGNFVWAVKIGGISSDYGKSITVDAAGKIYTTGHFSGTIDFDPGPSIYNLTATGFSDIFVHKMSDTSNPLPVELINFTANQKDNSVKTEWVTASEKNNDFFEVHKSKDGDNFESIGVVYGAGNSSVNIRYKFIDDNPFKDVSYYRLKQVDYDGTFEFSAPIAIRFTSADEINIYYNTNSDFLIINSINDIIGNYKLTDVVGKLIKEESFNEEYAEIDMKDFSPGIYFIEVKTQIKKIIKP